MSKIACLAIVLLVDGGFALMVKKQQAEMPVSNSSEAVLSAFSQVSTLGKSLANPLTVFGDRESIEATYQSFILISIAELFDKTWFVALLMALKYDKVIVFWGCFMALAAHTVLAAVLGYTIARIIPVAYLHFATAALYSYFAFLFWQDYLAADEDSDIIAAGKEEAAEDVAEDIDGRAGKSGETSVTPRMLKIFGACFLAMFIAEWGDRTQIAMIGQHASQPLIPVCLGSLAAFFILTSSAVIAGQLLANTKLSEKTVHLISTLSFGVFALLAVWDGITENQK